MNKKFQVPRVLDFLRVLRGPCQEVIQGQDRLGIDLESNIIEQGLVPERDIAVDQFRIQVLDHEGKDRITARELRIIVTKRIVGIMNETIGQGVVVGRGIVGHHPIALVDLVVEAPQEALFAASPY